MLIRLSKFLRLPAQLPPLGPLFQLICVILCLLCRKAASTLSWSLAFRLYFKKGSEWLTGTSVLPWSPSTAGPSKEEQARSCPLALFLNDQELLLEVFFILSQASFSRQETFLLLPGGSSLGCHNSGEGPANTVFGIHISVFSQCLTSLLWWILEASFRFLQTRNLSFMLKGQNRKILGSEMSNRQLPSIHHFQHSWFLSSKIPCISFLGPPYGKRVLWG